MKESIKLVVAIATIVFLAGIAASCSKDDNNDITPKDDGGLTIDPNIPVMSEITYELEPNTVVVPEADVKQISQVDTVNRHLTMPITGDEPKVGECIIINTPTDELPDGLLAKVKSVTKTSNGYEVTYEDAELMEAFKSIDIPEQYIPLNDMVEHIYDMDGNEVEFTRGTTTRASGIKPIEITLPEKALKFGAIEITPKMSMDMVMRYVLKAADYEIDYAHCVIDADITVGADMNLKTLSEAKTEKYIPLFRVTVAPIIVGPVVLTPWIQVNLILKAEGAVSLEASISYERTVHTTMHYQKDHGLSANMEFEPEKADALKYSFGPKFEGGFSYGLGLGTVIGLYGKVFTMGGSLQLLNKYTISSKIDLAALEGGYKDYLIALVDPSSLITGSKWKFATWEGFSLNQSLVAGFSVNLTVLNHDLAKFNVTELNFPIDSSPIMPQVEIEDEDFYQRAKDSKDVTLTLHHRKKSVLDPLTEFRAEFVPVGDTDKKNAIVKYFDFDDEKREWLKAEVKGADVKSTAKVTLADGVTYDLKVYMNILGIDITIFEGQQKAGVGNLKNVSFSNTMYCNLNGKSDIGFDYGGVFTDIFGSNIYPDKYDFTVTPIGNNGAFKCTASIDKEYDDTYYKHYKQNGTFSFTLEKNKDGSFGLVKDLEWSYDEEVYHKFHQFTAKVKDSGKATDLPLSWTNKSGTSFIWKGTEDNDAMLNSYFHSCVITNDAGEVLESYSFDKVDKIKEIEIGADFESQ